MRKHPGRTFGLLIDGDYTNAQANDKMEPLPAEVMTADLGDEYLNNLQSLLEWAVLKQQSKFVSTDASERVPAAEPTSQQRSHLLEKYVTRLMSSTIIYGFESVEIEIT